MPKQLNIHHRLTTPEKFDSATRRWDYWKRLLDHVGLVLVDEVHTLDEERGACLEGLVTRYKVRRDAAQRVAKMSKYPIHNLRIMALVRNLLYFNSITNVERYSNQHERYW